MAKVSVIGSRKLGNGPGSACCTTTDIEVTLWSALSDAGGRAFEETGSIKAKLAGSTDSGRRFRLPD